MPIPRMVTGRSIAETWEKALVDLHDNGIRVKTQYDTDPNTGVMHPPSLDCSMVMVVTHPLEEPRCHVCLEGGPEELGAYAAEVVEGTKDHWVARRPDGEEWTYTYSGRLHDYGTRLNSEAPESLFDVGDDDPDNPWVGLAYARDILHEDGSPGKTYLDIRPVDQIEALIGRLVSTAYTRRAVAITSFPPIDLAADDPPCLRYIWCRGYFEGDDGNMTIHMHTHWRSRDAYGAAFYNMFALTELMGYIVGEVQAGLDENVAGLQQEPCPVCLNDVEGWDISISEENIESAARGEVKVTSASDLICPECGSRPYDVQAGPYVDIVDSFHVYGKDLDRLERVLDAVENRDPEDRWWDLQAMGLDGLVAEGAERYGAAMERRDERDGISKSMKPLDHDDYDVPLTIRYEV